ncbi:hypothetical protein HKX48_004522 [Thoreauomyces humboldtii]|nr:hypothetical protein HKX48_004522 [Thoreauomyces humboldtii]
MTESHHDTAANPAPLIPNDSGIDLGDKAVHGHVPDAASLTAASARSAKSAASTSEASTARPTTTGSKLPSRPHTQSSRVVTGMFGKFGIRFVEVSKEVAAGTVNPLGELAGDNSPPKVSSVSAPSKDTDKCVDEAQTTETEQAAEHHVVDSAPADAECASDATHPAAETLTDPEKAEEQDHLAHIHWNEEEVTRKHDVSMERPPRVPVQYSGHAGTGQPDSLAARSAAVATAVATVDPRMSPPDSASQARFATALACLLDHDFSSTELSGWSAEAAGELTVFHLEQRDASDSSTAANAMVTTAHNASLVLPPRIGTPDGGGVRWRGASHVGPRNSAGLMEAPTAFQQHIQSMHHPLAKGGYTVTPSWKNRKEPAVELGGAIIEAAVGRIGTPPTYRDGYLMDANLPLRYNFIHPPLPPGSERGSDTDLGKDAYIEQGHTLLQSQHASQGSQQSQSQQTLQQQQQQHRQTQNTATGSTTAHAFPFAEERGNGASDSTLQLGTSQSMSAPTSTVLHQHIQQQNTTAGTQNLPGTGQAPSSVDQATTTQWRHQRAKAAMTMKELKKVFPPLMKQYLGKTRSSTTAERTAARVLTTRQGHKPGGQTHYQHRHSTHDHQYGRYQSGQQQVMAERPISRRAPPQRLRIRHGAPKVRSFPKACHRCLFSHCTLLTAHFGIF